MNTYIIKRVYNIHGEHDFLIDFDREYGTVCSGNPANALEFFADEIDAAVKLANDTCKGYNGAPRPDWMYFEKIPK